jgi:choline-sulfatase
VLLVSIDTLRADHVGAYGSASAHTPTLDGIAAAGVRFENAISPAPLTLPSHTTLLTGLDPPEHGVRHNAVFRLAADVPTIAERFRERGWQTGAFVGAFVLARQYGLDRGFDVYDDRSERPSSGGRIRGFAERSADAVVDAALAWLAGVGDHFFLWVHLYDPHAEYNPPPGFAAAFPGDPYSGEIAFADFQVGRLLRAVEERWPAETTLVVVTADHGESLGQHGEATHSHFVYEATQHIPLLMKGAGLPEGRSVEGVVRLKDVAPTLLEVTGAAPLPEASGKSLLPLVEGSSEEPRVAYVETLATQLDWQWSPLLGVRTQEYKYVRAPTPELYALASDPDEKRNLAALQPQRAASLDALLGRLLAAARPVAPNLAADDRDRELLESLGYVVPAPPSAAQSARLGVVGGPDPKDEIATAEAVSDADRLLGLGRGEQALALLEGLHEEGGPIVTLLKSAAALAAGRPELAERYARAGLAEGAAPPSGYARLAEALAAQDRLDEAREAWEELLRRAPEHGAALSALARIVEWQGDRERAIDLYRRALAASNPDPAARWQLAALLIETGEAGEADRLLAEMSADERERPGPALRLAEAEIAVGAGEAALVRLDAALQRNPRSVPLLLRRAELRRSQGSEEGASEDLERGMALVTEALAQGSDAQAAPALLLLEAELLRALGRPEDAQRALAAALAEPGRLSWEARARARRLSSAAPGQRAAD